MEGLWQAVADMQVDQKVFNDLRDVVNHRLEQDGAGSFDEAEVGEDGAATWLTPPTIRRFAEAITSTSMRRLLDELVTHQEVLTRENLRDHGCGTDATIDRLSKGVGLDPFPISVVEEDINALENEVDSIKTFVDKSLAHSDRNAARFPIPTYGKLASVIEYCRDLYERYALLLAGSSCQLQGPKIPFTELPECPGPPHQDASFG